MGMKPLVHSSGRGDLAELRGSAGKNVFALDLRLGEGRLVRRNVVPIYERKREPLPIVSPNLTSALL